MRIDPWRLLGRLLVLLGMLALGAEAVAAMEAGSWRLLPLGELWVRLDARSLVVFQAGVERYLHPLLWDPILRAPIEGPAALEFLGLGALLLWLRRERDTGRAKRPPSSFG